MVEIILVIGTRPQIIKSAPIILEAKKHRDIDISIVHTGQHYDYEMSKIFFNELNLPDPIVNLGVGSSPPVQQITSMMSGLEKVYNDLKPDVVIVPGDTNSTLAASLSAVKMRIPTAHIESGARSYDMSMPEEINRRIVDHISSRLYCVTNNCVNNLLKEGINKDKISLVGDSMYESILQHSEDIKKAKNIEQISKTYGVLTLHRESNVDDLYKLEKIIKTLFKTNVKIVFPCHPRTLQKLTSLKLIDDIYKHLYMIEPLPYYEMLSLVKNASVVITDSGGLQKEAYWLGTPCVTLREETEWIETVKVGANIIVGSDTEKIQSAIKTSIIDGFKDNGEDKSLLICRASNKILNDISTWFGGRKKW